MASVNAFITPLCRAGFTSQQWCAIRRAERLRFRRMRWHANEAAYGEDHIMQAL